jgi:hypothetical protein
MFQSETQAAEGVGGKRSESRGSRQRQDTVFVREKDDFAKAYDFPGARRTSNMIDRLMNWQDEYLFNRKYFHGTYESAETAIRAWAVLRNFQPYCARTNGKETELICAAGRLNGFQYSGNWLENLAISASMCGYRQ